MKKIICVLLTLAMMITSVPSVMASSKVTFSNLSEIGTLPEEKTEFEISYRDGTSWVFVRDEVLSHEEIDYLLSVFSDDNLISAGSVMTEYAQPTDVISDSVVFSFVHDSEDYHFYFNADEILAVYANGNESTVRQGLFKYKNADTYNELIDLVELNVAEQKNINNSDELRRMKNAVDISDFKIVYKAVFNMQNYSGPIEIGVCSYVKSGVTKETISAYFCLFDAEYLYEIALCDMPEDNAFKMGRERVIRINDNSKISKEYDWPETMKYSLDHKFYINVDDNMQAETIVVENTEASTGKKWTFHVNMDECEQTGKLPKDMFSSNNNKFYDNKVDNFEKLYTESVTSKSNYIINNGEWGICKYHTAASGDVHAFYFYSSYLDLYLISEITDKMILTPSGDVSGKYSNVANLFNGKVIENGYEIDDYRFTFISSPFSLRVGFGTDQSLIYRGIFYNDSGRNCAVTIKNISGDVSSLEFEELVSDATDESVVTTGKSDDSAQNTTANSDMTETENIKTDIIIEETREDNKTVIDDKQSTEQAVRPENTDKDTAKNNTSDEQADNVESSKSEADSLDYDFIDVPRNHWAYDCVHEFADKKIVLGYGNGYFGVDDPITYEHFSLLLERLFDYESDNTERIPSIREDVIVSVVKALKMDVSNVDVSIISKRFSDCENLQQDNLEYIAAAVEAGLVIGSDGKLFPEQNLTRAETVTLLSRAVEHNE